MDVVRPLATSLFDGGLTIDGSLFDAPKLVLPNLIEER